jgi:neurofibromin 1
MPSIGLAGRDQVLDDLGMRGLGELSFGQMKGEKVAPAMKLVAALIDAFTV